MKGKSIAMQAPVYSAEVFKALCTTLGVILMKDGTAISGRDGDILMNYDMDDRGLWLRRSGIGLLDWTPVCDLECSPGSPDPLSAPALPFPFTARQLAAFMLHGWGWLLCERFASEDGGLDVEAVRLLLGADLDAKAREAIAEAWEVRADAQQHVGEPYPENDASQEVWRKSMVRWLLAPLGDLPIQRRIPAARAQEEAIMTTLRSLGYDPLVLPMAPSGRSSPAKKAAKQQLRYSDAVMRKAWQRLLNDGRIKYT